MAFSISSMALSNSRSLAASRLRLYISTARGTAEETFSDWARAKPKKLKRIRIIKPNFLPISLRNVHVFMRLHRDLPFRVIFNVLHNGWRNLVGLAPFGLQIQAGLGC